MAEEPQEKSSAEQLGDAAKDEAVNRGVDKLNQARQGVGKARETAAGGGSAAASKAAGTASQAARTGATASRAAATGGASLAAEAVVDKKTRRKLIIILVAIFVAVALVLIAILAAIMAIVSMIAGSAQKDGLQGSKAAQYLDLAKTVLVCDSDGSNCEVKTKDVKGEKLLIYSIKVSPRSRAVKNVVVKDVFTEGKDKLQPGFLRLGIGSEPSFFDSEAGIKEEAQIATYGIGCSGDYSIDNICFGAKDMESPVTFTVSVRTKPELTENDVIIDEVAANGSVESFGGGDLNPACTFGAAARPIGSQRLAALMSEASAASGVPTEVIAAIAAKESPDFFHNAQDDHYVFSEGYRRKIPGTDKFAYDGGAGEIGLMQVSPPSRPSQYCAGCVQKAAELLGRKYEEVAVDDAFRDLRTNIYIGVGYLIGKMGSGSWSNIDDVRRAATSYNGSGSSAARYGGAVAADVAACRALGPIPTGTTTAAGGSSCPLDTTASVTSGTRANPSPLNDSGHCGRNYPTSISPWCSEGNIKSAGYVSAIYAFDITPDDNSFNHTVSLPKVEGQNVIWEKVASGDANGLGAFSDFKGVGENGTKYYTHIVHTVTSALGAGQKYPSGTAMGRLYNLEAIGAGRAHVHITVAKDSGGGYLPMDPPMEFNVCKK